ncbi:MAG: hypothetical protein JWP46_1725 [Modestobacter sp.]|jgi:hypothetical protein|nr:hypothetical protein [Modestobacter sp.]
MTTEHPMIPEHPMTPEHGTEPDWRLECDDHGVTALGNGGPVAHVEVSEDDVRVRLNFWVGQLLPHELRSELARSVFEHPALRPRRPLQAALPYGEAEVLEEVRAHVADARTHVAGVTCMLEGLVR